MNSFKILFTFQFDPHLHMHIYYRIVSIPCKVKTVNEVSSSKIMSLFRGNKLFTPAVNFINISRYSFAHKLVDTVKKEDEVLPLDFFRENCILVDANDKPIGSASKRDCHKVEGDVIRLHRAFSVFLFNKDGDMLLQKRSNHKVRVKRISSLCH